MAIDDLDKWNFLLSQLEIVTECTDELLTLNEAQLLKFESRSGLIFPQMYKEFCQVFGSGRFGLNMFYLECPDSEDVEGQLISNAEIMACCKSSWEWPIEVQKLLESAYLFGSGEFYVSFIFDMRTYSEVDKSYDIYGIPCYSGIIYNLGRDFFEFVRELCIGERAKEYFPELLVGVPEDIEDDFRFNHKTFVPC